MKLTKTEINAIAQEFLNELMANRDTISYSKWLASAKGKKAKLTLESISKKEREVEILRDTLDKEFKSRYIRTLKEIHTVSTRSQVPDIWDIQREIVIANIDSKSVEDLMKKLEAKFKPK